MPKCTIGKVSHRFGLGHHRSQRVAFRHWDIPKGKPKQQANAAVHGQCKVSARKNTPATDSSTISLPKEHGLIAAPWRT